MNLKKHVMKRTFLLLFAIAFVAIIHAQAPQAFSYQAVVRDNAGNLITNQTVALRISIVRDNPSGTTLYSERHSVATNAYGLFTVNVGQGTLLSGNFTTIAWGNNAHFIKVELDVNNGSTYTLMGTAQLLSVPYALHAETAGNVQNLWLLSGNNLYPDNTDRNVGIGTNLPSHTLNVRKDDVGAPVAIHRHTSTIGNETGLLFKVFGNTGIGNHKGGIFFERTASAGRGSIHFATDDNTTTNSVTKADARMTVTKEGHVGVGTTAPVAKLEVKGSSPTNALFDVKDADGNTVFAVYPEGAKVFVRDGATGSNAGFTVHGRKGANTSEWMRVTPDSIRFYLKENNDKSSNRGGFAVTGQAINKDQPDNYFNIYAADDAGMINNEARIVWYPLKEAFLAGRVLIQHPDSVGTNSWASGYKSKSIGNWSQALGYQAIARGDYSTAIGKNAVVNNHGSFAFGDSAIASGEGSYSIGAKAIAIGRGSFAIGSEGVDTVNWIPSGGYTRAQGNYSFAMGLGATAGARLAMAIGPEAMASGTISMALGYKANASGVYSTAIGYSSSATEWNSLALGYNTVSSGNGSFAAGSGSTASGGGCVSIGWNTSATGSVTTAIGRNTTASGSFGATAMGYLTNSSARASFALGESTQASGDYSFASGLETKAASRASIAMGWKTEALNWYAVAIGNHAKASGWGSTAMGVSTLASGDYSTATGDQTVASGRWSTAMGRSTTAPSGYETVIGIMNTDYTPASTTGWDNSDRLFVIGNGTSLVDKKNAFLVMKSGDVGIGNVSPNSRLHVNGDGSSPALRVQVSGASKLTVATNGGVSVGGFSDTPPANGLYVSGNVGFGTAAPAEKFHLRTASGDSKMRIEAPAASHASIEFYSGTNYRAGIGFSNSEGHFYIYSGGNVSVKDGNLGINTITPGQKLDIVAGNGRVQSSYSWLTNSDIRYKKNITTLENTLSKVLTLRGVRYDVNEDTESIPGQGKIIGFIAQELEEQFPEFVVTDDDGFKSVSYDKMTAVLLQAIKEQQLEIEELKNTIELIKTKVNASASK